MRTIIALCLATLLLAISYPVTPRGSVFDSYFGTHVADPYRWLEQTNSPQTTQWLNSQTAISTRLLDRLSQRGKIRSMLLSLSGTPRDGVPSVGTHATAWSRVRRGERSYVIMVRQGNHVRTLLDPNTLSPDGLTTVTSWDLSPDGRYLAYSTERAGSGWIRTHVLDVATSRELADQIIGVPDWAPITWSRDGSGLYYGGYGSEHQRASGTPIGLGYREMFHKLATAQTVDRLIYQRPDEPSWLPYALETNDGRYLVVGAVGGLTSGNFLAIRSLRPPANLRVIRDKGDATYTYVDNDGPIMYFFTNDHAPRGQLIAIDIRDPNRARDVIPQTSSTLVEVGVMAGGYFIAHYIKDVNAQLLVINRQGKFVRQIPLPGVGTATFSGDKARLTGYVSFTNLTTRFTVFTYNVKTGKSHLFERVSQPFDQTKYVTDELFANSTGGVRVPVFVAHRKGLLLDGKTPTLITGYGGFGVPYDPGWSSLSAAWLAQGGAFAIACVRGGGEYGESWHRAGMLGNKQHAFDDFAAAGRLLISRGFASPHTLAAYGYSGGGLLVGVTEVQHPDLFGAIVEGAGPVDVLRGQTYGSEATWIDEVGSPTASASQFQWLYRYAPLVHIRQGTHYPATLVVTSQNDARVSPAHAYKFAAALQWAQGGNAPILLYVAQNSGHIGNSVSSDATMTANAESFLLANLRH